MSFRALTFMFACAVCVSPAQAQKKDPPALYGLSHIRNDSTAKATIYYRWGSAAWKQIVIEQGKTMSFPFAYDGTSKTSPDLIIRFDADTDGVKIVEYKLSRGQSPDDNSLQFGHIFAIRQVKGTDTRFIEATSKNNAVATLLDANSTKPTVGTAPPVTTNPPPKGKPPLNPPNEPPALFGLAHIGNESTAKATIYYRWGTGAWRKVVVEKGAKMSFPYQYNGTSKTSPDLTIRLDADTDGVKFVEYKLSRGQSPDDNSLKFGHLFTLKQLKGTDTRFLEATTKGATATMTDAKSTKPPVQ